MCGLVTPWNYPLMMLSWKMAACLAAGNTVIIKPAQVSPLTACKFAELSARAGIPPGVINVLPGTGKIILNYFKGGEELFLNVQNLVYVYVASLNIYTKKVLYIV